ncbi:hypothetical protein [Enterococcus dongliensis]|uniref:hypothetical protein n=1 Tax=Enterococcus dongliensis TaxID=2559925 RepID=UPI00288E291A|nr:hypothetical protein [Enterococcus dongliensis]MDT2669979.1 hypothetical protein [Enterococcus dongliensis]
MISMQFTKQELERIFVYFDEGIDDWMEYHQQHEGIYEIDAGLKARFEDALYQMTPIEE